MQNVAAWSRLCGRKTLVRKTCVINDRAPRASIAIRTAGHCAMDLPVALLSNTACVLIDLDNSFQAKQRPDLGLQARCKQLRNMTAPRSVSAKQLSAIE